MLDVLCGLGEDVGLVQTGGRRQPFQFVDVDFGDAVEHPESWHGVLQLEELGVDVCPVFLLDLVVGRSAVLPGGGGASQTGRERRGLCPHGAGRRGRHAFVSARVDRCRGV